MSKTISSRLVSLWERGYLYIILIFIYYIWWLASKHVGTMDWYKEIAYFDYIRTSLKDYNMLPYYWWNIIDEIAWRPPLPGSSSFITVPETTFFSPLTPLLHNFNPLVYAKLYVFLQFLPGVIGIFALRKKLDWNNEQFRNYAALFLFSPIMLQHIAFGYFTWYNFYYFPWLVYFMAEKKTIQGIIGTAAVLGLIILQGGIYIVQYLGLFWLIYEIFHVIFEKDYKRMYRIIFIPILMILLSWARVGTSALVYGDYIRPWVEIDGYNIIYFLFYALIPTITIPPLDLFFHSDYLGWVLTPHDSGIFWGLSIIMIAFVIFKYRTIINNANVDNQNGLNYHAIFIASSILFMISFYKIWYFTMRGVSLLGLPFLETIKNHGIRFIMGAYFGYAIILANYSNSIWKEMEVFVKTKSWSIIKRILTIIGYVIFLGSGVLLTIIKVFKQLITDRFEQVITAAYNNTGQNWLRQRMEGMQGRSLEFYFNRFDQVYSSIAHWVFIVFVVSLSFYLIAYLLRRNKSNFTLLIQRFPYLKYELLLAIPLAFSTGMWMNHTTSVPFNDYPIRKVLPPEVIVDPLIVDYVPSMEVTPQKLQIFPAEGSNVKGYIFPQLPASDYKLFEITTNNAVLFNKEGQLMLKPLDNNPIEMQFQTDWVWKAIYITLSSWVIIIGFVLVSVTINIVKSKNNSSK